jgi:hypothetical protein
VASVPQNPRPEQDQPRPEGPSSREETTRAPTHQRRDYSFATERELSDLREQRDRLQQELVTVRAQLDTARSSLQTLEAAHAKLATADRIGQFVVGLATVAMVIGSCMISSDSSQGWMFGCGWGLVGSAVLFQVLVILFQRYNR